MSNSHAYKSCHDNHNTVRSMFPYKAFDHIATEKGIQQPTLDFMEVVLMIEIGFGSSNQGGLK